MTGAPGLPLCLAGVNLLHLLFLYIFEFLPSAALGLLLSPVISLLGIP